MNNIEMKHVWLVLALAVLVAPMSYCTMQIETTRYEQRARCLETTMNVEPDADMTSLFTCRF